MTKTPPSLTTKLSIEKSRIRVSPSAMVGSMESAPGFDDAGLGALGKVARQPVTRDGEVVLHILGENRGATTG